jgi:gamma-glutamyltranspeptidase/glutathione hydrolase
MMLGHSGARAKLASLQSMTIVRIALAAALFAAAPLAAHAQAPAPIIADAARIHPVLARHGMVASQEARATRVGVEILKAGGNAVDAAVAVGFALAVTLPRAGNIGGGGFMLVHLAGRNETVAIDYRETAPAATTRDVFLDPAGEADPKKSRESGLAVGVPGTVAGLALAHEKYGSGKFTLSDLIAPALALARNGFMIEDDLADSLPRAAARLTRWPSTRKIFAASDGSVLRGGDLLIQADLAGTLAAIAERGPRTFYEGEIAERIAAAVREAGGRMTADDLAAYRAVERAPVRGRYRGHEVLSMPPPSSGGVHLVQILNILEGFDLRTSGPGAAATLHPMLEAMKLAYADRSEFLGDPDFVQVPVAGLVSNRYAERLRGRIDAARAKPAREIKPGALLGPEGDQTTHYSVVDAAGNAVANTYTINFSYGLGLVAEGTGVLLNNELDDFAAKPGVPNAYGLVGGDANEPHDRTQGRPRVPGRRHAGRQPHHHHGAAGGVERDRSRHEHRRGRPCAAHPSPMAARRGDGRARLLARHHPAVGDARPPRQRRLDLGVRALDHADRRRLGRRRRHAPARHLGGGVLRPRVARRMG